MKMFSKKQISPTLVRYATEQSPRSVQKMNLTGAVCSLHSQYINIRLLRSEFGNKNPPTPRAPPKRKQGKDNLSPRNKNKSNNKLHQSEHHIETEEQEHFIVNSPLTLSTELKAVCKRLPQAQLELPTTQNSNNLNIGDPKIRNKSFDLKKKLALFNKIRKRTQLAKSLESPESASWYPSRTQQSSIDPIRFTKNHGSTSSNNNNSNKDNSSSLSNNYSLPRKKSSCASRGSTDTNLFSRTSNGVTELRSLFELNTNNNNKISLPLTKQSYKHTTAFLPLKLDQALKSNPVNQAHLRNDYYQAALAKKRALNLRLRLKKPDHKQHRLQLLLLQQEGATASTNQTGDNRLIDNNDINLARSVKLKDTYLMGLPFKQPLEKNSAQSWKKFHGEIALRTTKKNITEPNKSPIKQEHNRSNQSEEQTASKQKQAGGTDSKKRHQYVQHWDYKHYDESDKAQKSLFLKDSRLDIMAEYYRLEPWTHDL